ncbi:hypothetical protein ACRE58_17905, partial [Klebsiella pneumoniae]
KACVLPENPASYRVVRTKSYLFNKAKQHLATSAHYGRFFRFRISTITRHCWRVFFYLAFTHSHQK